MSTIGRFYQTLLKQIAIAGMFALLLGNKTFAQWGEGESPWGIQYNAALIDKVIVGDFNGDRRADIAYHNNTTANKWYVRLTVRDTSSRINRLKDPEEWCKDQPVYDGVWAADVNGDGRMDKITHRNCSGPNGGWWVSLSTIKDAYGGYEFSQESQWLLQSDFDIDRCLVADFDGDGRADIAYHKNDALHTWKVALSTGTSFVLQSMPACTGQGVNDGVWAADINGDGIADKVSHVNYIGTYGGWWVSFTAIVNGNVCFVGEGMAPACYQTDNNIDKCIIGDFDGNGRDDIAYHINNTTHTWKMIFTDTHNTLHLSSQIPCQWQGVNDGVYAGDFNGDGIDDKLSLVQYDVDPNNKWYVVKTIDNLSPQVGIWYRPVHRSWWIDDNGFWLPNKADSNQRPITGWHNADGTGLDTVGGPYNTTSHETLIRQLKAISECGFDFIISDNTNGIYPFAPSPQQNNSNSSSGSTSSPYIGDYIAQNGLRVLFSTLKESWNTKKIGLAISLGIEFWGPYTFYKHNIIWDGWQNQLLRFKASLDTVGKYIFDSIYYKYRGKPLFIPWIHCGYDYPLNYPDAVYSKLFHHNKFTCRIAVADASTYGTYTESLASVPPNFPGVPTYSSQYLEGQDSKRFWGFGNGPHDDQLASYHWNASLPIDDEQMAIMPGNYYTTLDPPVARVRRRLNSEHKDFYCQSWKQVIAAKPKIVTIAEWNDFTEGRAIEGCSGTNGWKDLRENYCWDYYMQITKAYIRIFKETTSDGLPIILNGTFVREEDNGPVYLCQNHFLYNLGSDTLPSLKPIIELPLGWLSDHGYTVTEGLDFAQNEASLAAFPNPFNPSVKIAFTLPKEQNVKVIIYDILGRQVARLIDGKLHAGKHETMWTATRFASGVYFINYVFGSKIMTKKIILTK